MRISFKNWLNESRDIFGFNKFKNQDPIEIQDENPITPINIENMMNELLRIKLNETVPFSKFLHHIQWGNNNGATQMVVSPLGSFKSIVRRLQTNLLGESVWICKKILPYKDIMHTNIKIEEDLAHILFDEIQKINEKHIESAIGDYKNLENLVVQLVRKCQEPNIMPEIFIFRGVKELKHNENYIIYFECRGQGVETPGSGRLEMFSIDMSYNPKTGLVRSIGHDIQSPKKGHVWYPQPSEWDEYFSPAQDNVEIIKCICGALSTY